MYASRLFKLAATMAWAALMPVALAGEPLTERFAEPLGSVPAGWDQHDASDKKPAGIAPQIAATGRFEGLKLERASRAWDNSALFYTAREFSDFTGTVLIHRQGISSGQAFGVALRAQKAGYRFDGYYVVVRYAGKLRGIAICENPVAFNDSGRELAFAPVPENLVSGRDYLLKFSAIGNVIKASLWDEQGSVQIGGEVVFDGAVGYLSGYFGLRSGFSGGDDGKPVYFRNLQVTPVAATP